MLNKTSHIDRLLPSMMTPYILGNVYRINIFFPVNGEPKEVVMRTYPATKINDRYDFENASKNSEGIDSFF